MKLLWIFSESNLSALTFYFWQSGVLNTRKNHECQIMCPSKVNSMDMYVNFFRTTVWFSVLSVPSLLWGFSSLKNLQIQESRVCKNIPIIHISLHFSNKTA